MVNFKPLRERVMMFSLAMLEVLCPTIGVTRA